MLLAVLFLHKRLKVFRASGERDGLRGQLKSFPWDILEAEVNRYHRSRPTTAGLGAVICRVSQSVSPLSSQGKHLASHLFRS
jgi:hypothetical protein